MPSLSTNDEVQSDDDRFELFGPGGCDKRLPANEVTEEFTFGQFVRLRVRTNGSEPRPIVGVIPKDALTPFLSMLSAAPLARAVSVKGLLQGKPESEPVPRPYSMPPRIKIDDLDELIVHRTVYLDTRPTHVDLDAGRLRMLLAGAPVETVARHEDHVTRVLLLPPAHDVEPASAPAVRQVAVEDLASFLANPIVPGCGGRPFPLRLTPEGVRLLRRDGVLRVGEGEAAVTVFLSSVPRMPKKAVSYALMSRDAPGHEVTAAEDSEDFVPAPAPYVAAVSAEGRPLTPPEAISTPRQSADAFAIGLYLPWRQSWRLKGYSRGALLHSLTLAPQEEATIELFTWDRRKRSLEQSSAFESEASIEQVDTTKDVIDVIQELTSSSEFQIQGHAQVNVKAPTVEVEAGVNTGYTSKLNETARRSTNHLHEATQKAAMRVRVSRQTRISESSETGREERVTRKIRNQNMCRTLTLDYFEVLAHYTVTTAFAKEDAQVCLFVPFPEWLREKTFGRHDLRVNERALRTALIDRALAPGFESARLLAARDWAMQHVCDQPYCLEHDASAAETSSSSTGSTNPSDTARKALEETVNRVVAASRALTAASTSGFLERIMKDGKSPGPSAALEVQRWSYRQLLQRHYGSAWERLEKLALAGTEFNLSWIPGKQLEPIKIPPIPMDEQISMLTQLLDQVQPPTLQTLDPGGPSEEVKQLLTEEVGATARGIPDIAAAMRNLERFNCADPDDAGLVAALTSFQKTLIEYRKPQGVSAGANADAVNLHQAQRQAKFDAHADQVQSAFPLADSAAAAERADALVDHLNAHASHYRYALLQAMPIGDQMQQLAQLGVPTDLVEPRILGMVYGASGTPDLLAVPINTALDPDWKRFRDRFIDQNTELTKLSMSHTVRMPTPGMSIEARLGECDACEDFIMESRAIELDQRRAQARSQKASARQAELEAERFEARIKKGQLDDPTPDTTGLHVTLDKPNP